MRCLAPLSTIICLSSLVLQMQNLKAERRNKLQMGRYADPEVLREKAAERNLRRLGRLKPNFDAHLAMAANKQQEQRQQLLSLYKQAHIRVLNKSNKSTSDRHLSLPQGRKLGELEQLYSREQHIATTTSLHKRLPSNYLTAIQQQMLVCKIGVVSKSAITPLELEASSGGAQELNLALQKQVWIRPWCPDLTLNHPLIHPSVHLSIQSSIYLSIHQSIHPSIHPSNHPSVQSSIHPSIYLCIYRPIYLSIHPFFHSYSYSFNYIPLLIPNTHHSMAI